MDGKPRIALVLGAGGLGAQAFEAGVLAALHEATGWDPRSADLVVGTSAGSRVAALLRAGLTAEDLYATIVDAPLSAAGRRLFERMGETPPIPPRPQARVLIDAHERPPIELLRIALAHPWRHRAGLVAAALPEGEHSTEPFAEGLRRLVGDPWPDGLLVPTARVPLGERVVFGRPGAPETDVATAVAASSAIPGYFRPVTIDGQDFVDGGFYSPTNLDLVAHEEVDAVLVLSPLSTAEPFVLSPSQPLRLLCKALLRRERGVVESAGIPVLALEPPAEIQEAMGTDMMDHKRETDVARLSRHATATLAFVEEVGDLLRRTAASVA